MVPLGLRALLTLTRLACPLAHVRRRWNNFDFWVVALSVLGGADIIPGLGASHGRAPWPRSVPALCARAPWPRSVAALCAHVALCSRCSVGGGGTHTTVWALTFSVCPRAPVTAGRRCAGNQVQLLRLLRLLRVLKLLKMVVELQMILKGLAAGMSSVGYVAMLMVLIFYLYGCIGA